MVLSFTRESRAHGFNNLLFEIIWLKIIRIFQFLVSQKKKKQVITLTIHKKMTLVQCKFKISCLSKKKKFKKGIIYQFYCYEIWFYQKNDLANFISILVFFPSVAAVQSTLRGGSINKSTRVNVGTTWWV